MNPQPGLLLALVVPATTSLLYLVVYLASRRRTLGALPGALLGVIFAILAVAVAVTLVSLRVGAFATILLGLVVSLLYSGALIRLFTRRAASQLRASVNTPAAETSETVAHRHIDQIPATPVPIPAPSRAARSGKLFICYRRDDSADVTGRIYDGLVRHFGRDSVFKDVDSIQYGLDFREVLEESVQQCDAMLVVIGRTWLLPMAGDKDQRRRLDDPADFVRIETEAAIRRDIPIIPVLVHGANPPRPDTLPSAIQDLAYRNGLAIRPDPDFHNDLARLVGAIERILARK